MSREAKRSDGSAQNGLLGSVRTTSKLDPIEALRYE